MKRLLVFLISFVALLGCSATGIKVSDEQISKLKKGETTQSQAVSILGNPVTTAKSSYGTTLIYSYGEYSARAASFIPVVGMFAGGADVRSSAVILRFDTNNVLADITSTQSQYGTGTGASAGNIDTSKVDQPKQ